MFIPDVGLTSPGLLLASSGHELWRALVQFLSECVAAGIKISSVKSIVMIPKWIKVECSLLVGDESELKLEAFCLGVMVGFWIDGSGPRLQ